MRRLLLLPALLLTTAAAAPGPRAFRPVSGLERAEGASALAFDAARERLAAGDARGVWLREADGRVRRALGSGPVHDLAFTEAGSLLAATERGLYEIGRDRRVRRHALGPGAAGRARRLAVGPHGWLVASDDGVLAARPGGPFRPLDGALPGGEASALTWDAGGGSLHAIVGGDLYAIRLAETADGFAIVRVAREALAGAGGRPVDLARDGVTGEPLLLRERALARRTGDGWTAEPFTLPPGLEPLRVASGGGAHWIASDAGLLVATGPGGRFDRVADSVGRAAASTVVVSGERVYVATARGVFLGAPERGATEPASRRPPPDFSGEPPVEAVHRVALRYLDLGAMRFASLQERVRRRGYLPELELFGDYGGFRARDHDRDETVFSSGGRHLLLDRLSESGRDFVVGAELHWDFSGPVYDPEEIDVSKEVRELIELRDEVLDEINQLYFERRRALLERARLADSESFEGERLLMRAQELAAGLDAWTGGWWSGQLSNPPRMPDPMEERP
ncbi:MAG: hypothetical protein ABFS41_08240 [Myxococcota bacterium]